MTSRRLLAHADSPAFRFVLIMGLVNLFGDMTYEGGAAINGQFLAKLGATAAAVSIIAGGGEFLGYALRSAAGFVADRIHRYWLVALVGYVINLLAVPAMALAGTWQLAAVFIVAERIGRAIRKPPEEAMLSYSAKTLGSGWVYALNTALDEIGATVGPLVVALVLFLKGSYHLAYAMLLISSALALASLTAARVSFPVPARLEEGNIATARGFTRPYWLFVAAGTLFACGLMSYELVAFHLVQTGLVASTWIPVLLAATTGIGVITNLVLGRSYDRFGIAAVLIAVTLSAFFTPLAFSGSLSAFLVAMPLWAIGYATQDTLLKAIIAGLLPEGRRGLAFGLFYTGYGVGWLVGSTTTGLLYEHSRVGLMIFAVVAQLASLPPFFMAARWQQRALRP